MTKNECREAVWRKSDKKWVQEVQSKYMLDLYDKAKGGLRKE